MDERAVTPSDLNRIETDIRELRGNVEKISESLTKLHVEVARGLGKADGDSRVLDSKTIMMWMILTAVGAGVLPIVIARLFPSAVVVNQQPAMNPIPVPPPVQR